MVSRWHPSVVRGRHPFLAAINYLLMRKSRTLKTTIPRMTSSGMNAYKMRKFAVNLDVAPGQVLSMKWIPWVMEHIGLIVMELLEPPAKETDSQL